MRRTPGTLLAVAAVSTLLGCSSTSATVPTTPAGRAATSVSAAHGPAPATSTPASTAHPDPAAVQHADATIARLTGGLGRRGVSIAAVDTADGVAFGYGARHGMLCASIAKLYILETLLLQHQQAHTHLGDEQRDQATAMIEHSDNDAANDLYVDIGEGRGLLRAAPALGVRGTTPGSGIYWGFTRTSAGAYLALLRDLDGAGPLSAASRRIALTLLSHVEADQQWGVGSVADQGSTCYLKNGWLAVSSDDDRWAVNSVGIVTVHGRRLLLAVLTQHGGGFDSGVHLVDHLAHLAASVVITR